MSRSSILVNGQWTEPTTKEILAAMDSEKEIRPNPERETDLEAALKRSLERKEAQSAAKTRPKRENAPQASQRAAMPVSVGGAVRVSENDKFNGVELRFPGPVSGKVSAELMRAGFRFTRSMNDPRWYAKRKPETLAFAKQIASQSGQTTVISETKPVEVPVATVEEFQWM